jgi:hypothetical protein
MTVSCPEYRDSFTASGLSAGRAAADFNPSSIYEVARERVRQAVIYSTYNLIASYLFHKSVCRQLGSLAPTIGPCVSPTEGLVRIQHDIR